MIPWTSLCAEAEGLFNPSVRRELYVEPNASCAVTILERKVKPHPERCDLSLLNSNILPYDLCHS
jgi:hypothetical protein